ncbi:unnamed protein product [Angiostrongylus costaricensis]|uniref:DIOX_N domain-containing protein n=1 Tax=Angiostrongylus costaricensis TaxID=334426 RepID=A0A0R3PF57_ANGCS|nr:unnamed protein product [Angiostrongylus costaricensis]
MERLTVNSTISKLSGHNSEPIRGASASGGGFLDPKYCVPEQCQENSFEKVLKWLHQNEEYMKPSYEDPCAEPLGL